MYFRGPAGVPFFVAPILSAIGLWRFARPPRRLADRDPAALRDAVVIRTCCFIGSYGMGGPGFAGLRVRPPSGPSIWIVFTIWAAAGWLTLDGALLQEGCVPGEPPDPSRRLLPLSALVGTRLVTAALTPDAVEFTFAQDGTSRSLRLQRDSSHLPVHHGSKQPKVLASTEDLRDAVVISQRGNLWLGD